MNTESQLSDPQIPSLTLCTQSSNPNPLKPKDLTLAKCISSDQSTTLCQSLSTLTSIQQTNTMGQEPSRNRVYNPNQVLIAITEPANAEEDNDLEQNANPQGSQGYPGRRKPRMMCCRECGKTGMSVISSSIGTGSWIIFLMFLMIGCLMCAWIPLVLPECMDVKHHCANCGALAGVNRYLLDG